MFRITAGLPKHELTLMANEARDCELALAKEIQILEAVAGLPITPFPDIIIVDEDESSGVGGNTGMTMITTTTTGTGDTTMAEGIGGITGRRTIEGEDGDGSRPNDTTTTKSTGSTTNDTTSQLIHLTNTDNNSATPVVPIQNPSSTIPSAYDPTNTIGPNYLTTADDILASKDLTPLDRYFTVSALLGRIRPPLDTPPPPHSSLAIARDRALLKAVEQSSKKKNSSKKMTASGGGGITSSGMDGGDDNSGGGGGLTTGCVVLNVQHQKQLEKYRRLIRLRTHNEIYTRRNAMNNNNSTSSVLPTSSSSSSITANTNYHPIVNTNTTALLALWKRISNHRTAAVFRRAVNAKEAPGYNDRIPFPIDLSLIKKMIACGQIQTFEELHQRIGLICHNCVKFNGRESDYALLTRDFESYVDDSFLDVLQKLKDKARIASNGGGGSKK